MLELVKTCVEEIESKCIIHFVKTLLSEIVFHWQGFLHYLMASLSNLSFINIYFPDGKTN